MKIFANRLFNALENELFALSLPEDSDFEKLKRAIKVCKKAMVILKRHLASFFFDSMEDEVYFFKNLKPKFYSRYIYYITILNFEIKKPNGTEEIIKEYVLTELSTLKKFFDENQSFYQYHRTNSNHLDSIYFTRRSLDIFTDLADFYGDEMFSTSHDYKLSKILANEKYQEYLQSKLVNSNNFHNLLKTPIVWTSNQTDLVELIYALAESGSFNNGNIEIKSLMDFFQTIFNVDLKYYYRKYSDITYRKKEKTAFLDRLKLALLKKIDNKYELK
ncbi:MAG: tetracycline regulation of excision, RteC [Sphingobacteriales bacterium]|nr:tetracycline regulation of excision, RteC [Sphingobacteriales bacterium]